MSWKALISRIHHKQRHLYHVYKNSLFMSRRDASSREKKTEKRKDGCRMNLSSFLYGANRLPGGWIEVCCSKPALTSITESPAAGVAFITKIKDWKNKGKSKEVFWYVSLKDTVFLQGLTQQFLLLFYWLPPCMRGLQITFKSFFFLNSCRTSRARDKLRCFFTWVHLIWSKTATAPLMD